MEIEKRSDSTPAFVVQAKSRFGRAIWSFLAREAVCQV